jgi:hypothetical protein
VNSAALLLTAFLCATGEEHPLRVEVLGSPTFSMEEGVRMAAGAEHVIFLYDGALSQRIELDESTAWRRALGILGRSAKLFLLDGPALIFIGTFEHEVFGHGARQREQGDWPTYTFGVPYPYRWIFAPHQSNSGSTSGNDTGFVDHDLPVYAGGIEANSFSAHFRALEGFRDGGSMHFTDSLHYAASLLEYSPRWVSGGTLGTESGGDPDQYAAALDRRFNLSGNAKVVVSQRLRWAFVASFVNPMWWLSVYASVAGYLGRGERWSHAPQLHIGDTSLFVLTRFSLSPFGAEHTLDVLVSRSSGLIDVYARFVSTGLAPAAGVGARVFRWEVHPKLELGGQLDVWVQPELLPQYRNAFDGRLLPGFSALVEATWRPFTHLGFVAHVGGKTSGYVMSQPLSAGVFGFAGVALYSTR